MQIVHNAIVMPINMYVTICICLKLGIFRLPSYNRAIGDISLNVYLEIIFVLTNPRGGWMSIY